MAPQESYKQYFGENLQSVVLPFTFSNFSIVRIESNFVMNQTKIFKLNKPLGNISSRQIRLYTTNSFSDGYAELSNLYHDSINYQYSSRRGGGNLIPL